MTACTRNTPFHFYNSAEIYVFDRFTDAEVLLFRFMLTF